MDLSALAYHLSLFAMEGYVTLSSAWGNATHYIQVAIYVHVSILSGGNKIPTLDTGNNRRGSHIHCTLNQPK